MIGRVKTLLKILLRLLPDPLPPADRRSLTRWIPR